MDSSTTDFKLKLVESSLGKGCIPSLSFKERITMFTICWVAGKYLINLFSKIQLGLLISIFSSISFLTLLTGNAKSFAIFYSIGNIISMAG